MARMARNVFVAGFTYLVVFNVSYLWDHIMHEVPRMTPAALVFPISIMVAGIGLKLFSKKN